MIVHKSSGINGFLNIKVDGDHIAPTRRAKIADPRDMGARYLGFSQSQSHDTSSITWAITAITLSLSLSPSLSLSLALSPSFSLYFTIPIQTACSSQLSMLSSRLRK